MQKSMKQMTDKEKTNFVLHIWSHHSGKEKDCDGNDIPKNKSKLSDNMAATIIQRWARRHVIKGKLHHRFDQSHESKNMDNIGSLSVQDGNRSTGGIKHRGPSFDESKKKIEIFDIESLSMVRI